MADDIEVGDLVARISFDDTGLNSSMAAINRSMRLVQAEFDRASSALGAYSSEEERLTAQTTNLSRQMQLQQQKVNRLNEAFQESVREKGLDDAATQRLATQLAQARTQYNRLNSELDTTNRQLEEQRRAAGRTESAWDRLHGALNNASGALKTTGTGITTFGVVASAGIGSVIKEAANFEQSMSNVKAVMSPEEIDKYSSSFEELALQMGEETKFSATEAAQGIEELQKAGVAATDIMADGLKGALTLAVAGNIELSEAAEIASTALNAFRDDNLSVVDAANIMAGAANASATSVGEIRYGLSAVSAVAAGVGLSFEDTSAALATFAQNGLKGSDSGTSLKTMLMNLIPSTNAQIDEFERLGLTTYDTQKAMQVLARNGVKPANSSFESVDAALKKLSAKLSGTKEGSEKAQKEFVKLAMQTGVMGSAFYDSEGSIKSMSDIAGTLQTALAGMTDEQRAMSLETMFGSDAIRAGNILFREGADGVNKMKEAMGKVSAEDVAKEKMNNLNGAIETLKGSIQTLMISVGDKLLPTIKNITAGFQRLVDLFNGMPEPMKTAIAVIGSLAAGLALIVGPALLLAGFIPQILLGLEALAPVFAALTGPIGLVIAAIAAIVAGIVILYNKNEAFRKFVDTTWAAIKDTFVKTLAAIKAYVLPIVNEIVGFVQGQLGELKALWSEHGASITKAVKAAFGLIVGYIKIQLAVVETIFRTVWPIIEGVVRIAWETIKFVISSAIDVIIGFVKVFAKIFKGDWKGAFDEAFATMKRIWGNIENWFHGINLLEIGKNIIQGLLKGLDSMTGAINKQVEKISKLIPEGIRDFLGIHSPSKETTELGRFAAQGLANGLGDGEKDIVKAAEKAAKASYDATKEWIDERKYYNQITLEEELAVWDKVASRYKAGTEQRKAADREAYRVKQEMLKAEEDSQKKSFESSKKWIETKKEFNTISLTQELAAWERVQARYKAGTQEHQDAEKAIIGVRKEIYAQLTAASEEFLTKTKEINANVEAEELRLNQVYAQAVDDRAKSIYSFAGLFDEVTQKADVAGSQLISNLENQVNYLETWAVSLAQLAERGIDKGLVEELRLMGPNAAAEIAALNRMTDSELFTFEGLWKEKSELARYAALNQMTGLRTDTDAQIVLLKKEAALQLDGLKKVFEDKVKEIRTGTVGGFNIMTAELPEIGKQAMQGLINGMDGMKSEVMSKAREIANSVSKTIQKALDIHSPSRVTMELGEFTGQGLAEGLEKSLKSIQQQAAAMAEVAIPTLSKMRLPDMSGLSSAAAAVSAPNVTNHYYVSATIPAKDIAEMKTANDFFVRLKQTARAMG